jgi:glycosyltransferase involved in cell wall biosynthesis
MKTSIIIPTFNYDKYIARAIRSCIEQSFSKYDFEIIVVNDSSKDSTKYILESYGHWITVIENVENKGLPYSRNLGIRHARGEYIVNLDADDYLHRDYLKICSLFLEFNSCDAVATDYFLMNDEEEIITRINVHDKPIACGIMFRKQQMVDVGLYDTSLKIGEDVDFRMRFERRYTLSRINLPLYRYRMHKNNLTADENRNRKFLSLVSEKNGCVVNYPYHSAHSRPQGSELIRSHKQKG